MEYLFVIKDVKEVIRRDGRKIKFRFVVDGRRISKRIGIVMVVFNILVKDR